MDMKLADRLYLFCPELPDKGLEIILQELPSPLEKLSGTLPENAILSSGVSSVEWDEEINGKRTPGSTRIGSRASLEVKVRKGVYRATTIIVSKETLLDFVKQIKQDKKHSYNNYTIFDMTKVRDDCKQNTFNFQINNKKRQ